MDRFGPDPQAFFQTVYQGHAPWDIGQAQPALLALFDEFPPPDPVLDVGCGSGDLAIALARRGHQVLGVDFVPQALDLARERARDLAPEVAQRLAFQVGDALHPSHLGRFGAVVDCGFLHLFEELPRDRFAQDLARSLEPGGRSYLLAFAVTFDVPNTPLQVTEAELRARFSEDSGWRTLAIRPAEFQSRIAPVPAIAACFQRVG